MRRPCLRALLVCGIASLLGAAGCKQSGDTNAASSDVIRIGEYASLTGKEAAFGQSSHKGTVLAIDELNASGGVLGKKLKLVTEDNQSKAGESATAVTKLITRDKVVAMLGEVASSRSLEGGKPCQDRKIPMISPSSTNPKVTEVGDYIFRVCFIDPFQGRVIAEFAHSTLKVKKVAILTDVTSAYSTGLADYFREPFVKAGGTIVAEQKYSGGDKDFNAQLTAIKALGPDAIFVPGYYTEAALIVSQGRKLGINIPFFGGDGWEAEELLQIGGKAMEGTYYSTHYAAEDPDPRVQAFVKTYKQKFGKTPDSMAALGYDAAMMLADAIKRAGSAESTKIRDALAATKDFEGITGKTTMDENRNASKTAVIIHVKNGKLNLLQTIKP